MPHTGLNTIEPVITPYYSLVAHNFHDVESLNEGTEICLGLHNSYTDTMWSL